MYPCLPIHLPAHVFFTIMKCNHFISDCKKLVTKLGQYFDVAALRKRFQVFINKHFNVWGKYGVPLSVNHVFVNIYVFIYMY